jgi:hypothetical protein
MSAVQQVLFGSGGGVRFIGISDRTIESFDTAPQGATAAYGLNQGNITVIEGEGSVSSTIDQWVSPNSASGDYQVRAIQTGASGGTLVGGTLNEWINLGPNIQWFLNVDAIDTGMNYITRTGSRTLAISIRRTSDLQILSSATIILNATARGNE